MSILCPKIMRLAVTVVTYKTQHIWKRTSDSVVLLPSLQINIACCCLVGRRFLMEPVQNLWILLLSKVDRNRWKFCWGMCNCCLLGIVMWLLVVVAVAIAVAVAAAVAAAAAAAVAVTVMVATIMNVFVVCLQHGWWENWMANGKTCYFRFYYYIYFIFSSHLLWIWSSGDMAIPSICRLFMVLYLLSDQVCSAKRLNVIKRFRSQLEVRWHCVYRLCGRLLLATLKLKTNDLNTLTSIRFEDNMSVCFKSFVVNFLWYSSLCAC